MKPTKDKKSFTKNDKIGPNKTKTVNKQSSDGPLIKRPQFKKSNNQSKGNKLNQRKNEPGAFVRIKPGQLKISRFEEKRLDQIREQSERKAEREAKKLQQKKQQKRKTKILSKKNKKGQPVMGGRMQLLLEKIEKRLG